MKSDDRKKYFETADFVVFFSSLIVSVLIGIYFGYRDKNKKSTETYYYGDRNMSPLAVAMSMAVSFVSAIMVLGYPVETYFYGTGFLWMIFSTLMGAGLAAIYFIPLIFRLQLKSMFELLYMGNTVYLPALALNSVTPLDLEWSIAVTSIVCTFYTTLGGIKAVIWTDVLQGFVMVFGALALFIKATVDVGGIIEVFDSAGKGGRLNFFKFEPDIRMRSSALNFLLGYFIIIANASCFSQVFAQRYMSCKSVSKARIVQWLAVMKALALFTYDCFSSTYTRLLVSAAMMRVLPVAVFMLLAAADGLAMYAYYEGCDPYKAGYISKKDQLTPRFAVEIFQSMPGLAGLFVAAAYSGTLSTVSSGINSLAAVTTEDFIDPFWPRISASQKSFLAKIFTVSFGCLVACIAYAVSRLESTIIQINLSLAGTMNGPIFGVFLLGTMCPWVNENGVVGGIVIGTAFTAWCSLGRIVHGVSSDFVQTLPVRVEECYSNATMPAFEYGIVNMSNNVSNGTEAVQYRSFLEDTLYSISPFLHSLVGFLVGSVCMIIISGISGFNKPSKMKPEIFVPIIRNEKIFSKRIVKFFRFGVPEITDK